jgi:receptor expression-enhancing protein 1/2/3/4
MLMSFLSNLMSAYFAFLLPCYSTFKALSHRPVSEPDLERLCMYWTVIGAFVAFQYTAEWLISWFPFYFEIKTLFLLFLALPQIQGSTFIYQNYFQPFFSKNETELDAGINSFQNNIFVFVQTRISSLIDIVWSLVNKTPASGQPATGTSQQPGGTAAGGFTMDSALSLWKAYGPAVMGGLSRPPVQPASSPSASSTSLQPNATPNANRRPSNPSVSSSPAGTPNATFVAAPPFSEPQHL